MPRDGASAGEIVKPGNLVGHSHVLAIIFRFSGVPGWGGGGVLCCNTLINTLRPVYYACNRPMSPSRSCTPCTFGGRPSWVGERVCCAGR